MSTKYIEIRLTKYILYFTEPELQSLLARDPPLWKEAIKRGKAFTRATQTRERVARKTREEIQRFDKT